MRDRDKAIRKASVALLEKAEDCIQQAEAAQATAGPHYGLATCQMLQANRSLSLGRPWKPMLWHLQAR